MNGLTDLSLERQLYDDGIRRVIGMDEVGRGCTAGPVGVGAVWFSLDELLAEPAGIPEGLNDSKQITPARRPGVAQSVRDWQDHAQVSYASAAEIDEIGLTAALALAGRRALAELPEADVVLLDGKHNWLSYEPSLVDAHLFADADAAVPEVRTFIKGDGRIVTIAAASVIAKVDRDALMVELDAQFPEYGWAGNKGYPSPAHKRAVAEFGPTEWHRRSFAL